MLSCLYVGHANTKEGWETAKHRHSYLNWLLLFSVSSLKYFK